MPTGGHGHKQEHKQEQAQQEQGVVEGRGKMWGAWVHCTGTGIRTGAPWHVNAVVMLMQAVWGSQPGQDWLPTLLMNKLGLKYDPARMHGGCTSSALALEREGEKKRECRVR